MKRKFTSLKSKMRQLPVLFIALLMLSGFTLDDSCRSFYPMEEGKKFEMTSYNAKDKMQSRVEYEVVDKKISGNKASATISMAGYDNKNKESFSGDFTVYCEDGLFTIDMKSMLNAAQLEQMEAFENMETTWETQNLELPASMKVGDQLKDGSLNMTVKASGGGMTIMSLNTTITDRKVIAEEKMTTPAGTFDCLVITSSYNYKAGFVTVTYDTKEWFAENVGPVRSETYRKGSLESYTLLTKLN